eukprot:380684-Pelagomonas_calceolata.AAC.1
MPNCLQHTLGVTDQIMLQKFDEHCIAAWKKAHVSSKGTLASLDDINYRILLDKSQVEKEKKNYVGRGNSPYINQKKGDTLAQKSRESPPPQSYKKKF